MFNHFDDGPLAGGTVAGIALRPCYERNVARLALSNGLIMAAGGRAGRTGFTMIHLCAQRPLP